MRKSAATLALLLSVATGSGCNRQDAETLARISQMLADRAMAVPIVGPQGKPVRAVPTSMETAPRDAALPEPKNERHGG